jgi:diacylglycerol kinase
MHKHYRRFLLSLSYAINGIRIALRYEPHMRVHVIAGFLASLLAFLLKINEVEWIYLLMTITLVLFAELMNTALEANVDLATKIKRPEAKIAKDAAAGAVLITSINALICGIIIFAPKIAGIFFN